MKLYFKFIIVIFLILSFSCKNISSENEDKKQVEYTIFPNKKDSNPDTLIKYYSNQKVKYKRIKDTIQEKILIYKYDTIGNLKSYIISLKIDSNYYSTMFERDYVNNSIKDTGYIITGIIGNNDSLVVGDEFSYNIVISRPPNCMYYLTAYINNDTLNYKTLEVTDNIAKFSYLPDTAGKYEIILNAGLKDTLIDTIVTHQVLVKLTIPSSKKKNKIY